MSLFRRDQDAYRSSPVPSASKQPVAVVSEPPAKEASPVAAAEPAGKAKVAADAPTKSGAAPSTIPAVNREAAAVIDRNSEITGTLHSQGNVLVEGQFQGEIEAKETVWVERGAQTQAQLRAHDVIIAGSFNGEIVCEHRLQIASTATISGEIKTPVLVIEEGSTINCRFNMTRSGR